MSRFDAFSRISALFLAWMLLAAAASAQNVPSLEEIQQDYRVVQLSRGWVLQPLEGDDFDTLEILDGAVTIDGAELSEADLRRFVDNDADWILAMAAGDSPRSEDEASDSPPDPPLPPDTPEFSEGEPGEDDERRSRRRYRNRRDTQVSFGSGLRIEKDESVREVVLFSGPLIVDGEVDGDATVILGSAKVRGRVDGSLVVIGGPIHLGPDSVIDGDVVSVGGGIRREPGSEVDGEITQVGIGEAIDLGDLRIDLGRPNIFWPSFELFDFSWFDLFGRAIGLGLLGIILLLVLLLAPNKVEAISERAKLEPWKSGLVGLLVEVLFAPLLGLVCIVLLISIVGIPLLIFILPLMCLAMVVYLLLGFAGVSLTTGRWIQRRFDWQGLGKYLLLMIGLFFLYGWSILGEAMSITPWPIRLTAILLLMLGFCLKYLAWTIGLGAAVLDQFSPLPSPPGLETWDGRPPEDPSPSLDPPSALPGSDFGDPLASTDLPNPPEDSSPASEPEAEGDGSGARG